MMKKYRPDILLSRGIGFLSVVVMAWMGSAGAVELPFAAPDDLTTTLSQPREIAAADYDLDGDIDLMVVADDAGVLRRWRNDGTGSFVSATISSSLDAPSSIALGDIDGDGDIDAVIGQSTSVSGSGAGEVMWFENPEIGVNSSWTSHVAADFADARVNDLLIADIDSDGFSDIVIARGINDVALVWLENDGSPANGGWSEHEIDSSRAGLALAAADIDSDGDLDIVSRVQGTQRIAWWEHDGTPTDGWSFHYISSAVDYVASIVCGDVTNNGKVDVVASREGDDVITLYQQASNGSWSERQVSSEVINDPISVELADLDADGDLDILATIFYSDRLNWYENSGGTDAAWTVHLIDSEIDGAYTATAADFDGDGDLDVAGAGMASNTVSWYENRVIHREMVFDDPVDIGTGLGEPRAVEIADINGDGLKDVIIGEWDDDSIIVDFGMSTAGNLWWKQTVVTGFDRVRDVAAADMDSDGDLDIVGAAVGSDQVWWWANDGDAVPDWSSKIVLNGLDGAHMAEPVDLDRDGDPDLVVAAFDGDEVAWVENTNGLGTAWTKYVIDNADGAHDVVIGDFNSDGLPDIAYSAYYGDFIKVAMKPVGNGDFWSLYTVQDNIDGPRGLDVADIDGDGDLDIAAAIRLDNVLAWYENDGTGINWTLHSFGAESLIDGAAVRLGDLDRDGDIDLVASSQSGDDLWVWENRGAGLSWFGGKMEDSLDSPWALALADINSDGKTDIIAAAGGTADRVCWYAEVGGQMDVNSSSTAPDRIVAGTQDDVLKLTIRNNGVDGSDGPIEPDEITLRFTDEAGTALTSAQANKIFNRIEIYADSDDDGVFSSGDTLLVYETSFPLSGGSLTIEFGHALPQQEVDPGETKSYFITITTEVSAWMQVTNSFRVEFSDSGLSGQDVGYQLPVDASPGSSVQTDSIEIVNPLIFSDGFDDGGSTNWSATVS